MSRIELEVQGMTCASCASHVEHALAAVPGVREARVNLPLERAAVEGDPADIGSLVQAVERAGYQAKPIDASKPTSHSHEHHGSGDLTTWRNRLIAGFVIVVPMLWIHFAGHSDTWRWPRFLLATAMQLVVGWPFFVSALRRLRYGSASMDSLIEMGSLAAYFAGLYMFVTRQHDMYFMDSALILEFVTLGKYLELRAKRRASLAIRKMLDLSPAEARVIRDGQTVVVPVEDVQPGETIVIRPGDRVPLDARILEGASAVNQAWLTGESLPVDKQSGDEILAGAVNGSGSLTAEVLRPVGQTALARVIELVRRAQESKADVQRFADRVVAYFVPGVIAIATLSLVGWGVLGGDWQHGIAAAVAVVVVACPCALGLATPAAILVASGRGAELGILVKEAHALETAGQLTTVVLDKTGTITVGRPQVTDVVPQSGVSEQKLLALAAAAEGLSSHPLAEPIVNLARSKQIEMPSASGLQVVPGAGVAATVNLLPVLVGNERLLDKHHVDYSAVSETIRQLREAGKTPLLVAEAGKLLGLIAVADVVAPTSREAVAQLRKLGLKVIMLSGDARATAQTVAREVGIDQLEAEVLPERKGEVIAELQRSGQVVAMVGDGINDAPALAIADLGIAIGTGADIAIETADVVIAGNDLRKVALTVSLARATLRTIRQNLGWAFGYNLALLPLAAGLFVPFGGPQLPPVAAAAAMSLSSVSVVLNSLLLRRRISAAN
jgi:Cu+-exporting ATPase